MKNQQTVVDTVVTTSFRGGNVWSTYHDLDRPLELFVGISIQVLVNGLAEKVNSTGGQKVVALHVSPNLSTEFD